MIVLSCDTLALFLHAHTMDLTCMIQMGNDRQIDAPSSGFLLVPTRTRKETGCNRNRMMLYLNAPEAVLVASPLKALVSLRSSLFYDDLTLLVVGPSRLGRGDHQRLIWNRTAPIVLSHCRRVASETLMERQIFGAPGCPFLWR